MTNQVHHEVESNDTIALPLGCLTDPENNARLLFYDQETGQYYRLTRIMGLHLNLAETMWGLRPQEADE